MSGHNFAREVLCSLFNYFDSIDDCTAISLTKILSDIYYRILFHYSIISDTN